MVPMGFFGCNGHHLPYITTLTAEKQKEFATLHTHHEIKDNNGKVTSRVYNIITPIMSPIFKQNKPLPTNVSIGLNFRRTIADIPLLRLKTDSNNTFATKNIQLKDVRLECTYLDEDTISNKYNFITKNQLKYSLEEPVIRTFTIDKGLNTATINVNTGGHLPNALFSTLTTPEAFFGNYGKSATAFSRENLTGFEVLVDNSTLPGSKLKMNDKNISEPFVAFLRNTKLYNNALAGKTMRMIDYEVSNFILSYDLSTAKQDSGWLSLKYDFSEFLTKKVMVVVFMVYDKQLVINKEREVFVNN